MNLQDVINNCDINYKAGNKVKYVTPMGIQKEGTILQVNLILNSLPKFIEGTVEYVIEYDATRHTEIITEEEIIR